MFTRLILAKMIKKKSVLFRALLANFNTKPVIGIGFPNRIDPLNGLKPWRLMPTSGCLIFRRVPHRDGPGMDRLRDVRKPSGPIFQAKQRSKFGFPQAEIRWDCPAFQRPRPNIPTIQNRPLSPGLAYRCNIAVRRTCPDSRTCRRSTRPA